MKNFFENAQHFACQPDTDHPCLTCSDEAVAVRVVYVEPSVGIAFVEMGSQAKEISSRFIREEVDITLVDDIAPGDFLLVHGGVAIARLEEGEVNVN